jgi:hypothetical protein
MLLAALLQQVRRTTEQQLGESLPAVVVAVRGSLRDAQRRATIAACRLGGLEVRRLVHATTAVALAYHAGRTAVEDETIAVIDFGGGGFDAAIFEVGERSVEVLAQRGIEVGGEDLDARVVEWLLAEFREQTGRGRRGRSGGAGAHARRVGEGAYGPVGAEGCDDPSAVPGGGRGGAEAPAGEADAGAAREAGRRSAGSLRGDGATGAR